MITPGTTTVGGTLVTQNHLQNIQHNIFLPGNFDGQEWCDSSTYGFSKFPSSYRGDRIDADVEMKFRTLEREKEESERVRKEAERLLDEKVKQLQMDLARAKEKHKKHMVQAKERHQEQMESYKDRCDQQVQRYKEKYEEAKENLRKARQMQITTEQSAKQMDKLREIQLTAERTVNSAVADSRHRSLCIIQ